MPESCCKPTWSLQQLLMPSPPAALKAQLYASQFVIRQQLQTDRYCRFFHRRRKGKKSENFDFLENNGQGD